MYTVIFEWVLTFFKVKANATFDQEICKITCTLRHLKDYKNIIYPPPPLELQC